MPPRRRKNRHMAAVPSADGKDRLTALPDDALLHILSLLPSVDAVRTSVLARRWCHTWKSARAIRVTTPRPLRGGDRSPWSRGDWTASTLTSFVNHLLLLRGAAPVDDCDIICGQLRGDGRDSDEFPIGYKYEQDDKLNRTAGLWIRHALETCHARALDVYLRARRRLCLDGMLFAGRPLTTVELTDATFVDYDSSVDFSRCPALQDLTMRSCKIRTGRICSPSLTRLSIDDGCSFAGGKTRTRISTPRLVSLQLEVTSGRAPLLESMPLLVNANVVLKDGCYDMCNHLDDGSAIYLENLTSCDRCYGTHNGGSVLLEGLSDATDLELISDPRVFIFRKDCKSLTTFNKLKTLLLNEWCMAVDFSALAYFLQCSPVLEKLTLQLGRCETRHPVVKTDRSNSPTEQSFLVAKQLMGVEIKCFTENELVKKLLILLTTKGIPLERIHVEQNFSPPDLSGYETNSDYGDW